MDPNDLPNLIEEAEGDYALAANEPKKKQKRAAACRAGRCGGVILT